MKKMIFLAVLAIGMTATAQTQSFNAKLRLRNVPSTTIDSTTNVLVQGTDKIIKKVPASALAGGTTEVTTGVPYDTGITIDGQTLWEVQFPFSNFIPNYSTGFSFNNNVYDLKIVSKTVYNDTAALVFTASGSTVSVSCNYSEVTNYTITLTYNGESHTFTELGGSYTYASSPVNNNVTLSNISYIYNGLTTNLADSNTGWYGMLNKSLFTYPNGYTFKIYSSELTITNQGVVKLQLGTGISGSGIIYIQYLE